MKGLFATVLVVFLVSSCKYGDFVAVNDDLYDNTTARDAHTGSSKTSSKEQSPEVASTAKEETPNPNESLVQYGDQVLKSSSKYDYSKNTYTESEYFEENSSNPTTHQYNPYNYNSPYNAPYSIGYNSNPYSNIGFGSSAFCMSGMGYPMYNPYAPNPFGNPYGNPYYSPSSMFYSTYHNPYYSYGASYGHPGYYYNQTHYNPYYVYGGSGNGYYNTGSSQPFDIPSSSARRPNQNTSTVPGTRRTTPTTNSPQRKTMPQRASSANNPYRKPSGTQRTTPNTSTGRQGTVNRAPQTQMNTNRGNTQRPAQTRPTTPRATAPRATPSTRSSGSSVSSGTRSGGSSSSTTTRRR